MPDPISAEALYPKGDGLLESFTRLARSKGMVIHASPFDTYETYGALDLFTAESYVNWIANFVELFQPDFLSPFGAVEHDIDWVANIT